MVIDMLIDVTDPFNPSRILKMDPYSNEYGALMRLKEIATGVSTTPRTPKEQEIVRKAKMAFMEWLPTLDPKWYLTITDVEQRKEYLRTREEKLGELLEPIDTASFPRYREMYDSQVTGEPSYLHSLGAYESHLWLLQDIKDHPERHVKGRRRPEVELNWYKIPRR